MCCESNQFYCLKIIIKAKRGQWRGGVGPPHRLHEHRTLWIWLRLIPIFNAHEWNRHIRNRFFSFFFFFFFDSFSFDFIAIEYRLWAMGITHGINISDKIHWNNKAISQPIYTSCEEWVMIKTQIKMCVCVFYFDGFLWSIRKITNSQKSVSFKWKQHVHAPRSTAVLFAFSRSVFVLRTEVPILTLNESIKCVIDMLIR